MTLAERKRFAGILGRLGSDHDGERAAAALLATRMLRSAGLTWQHIVLPGDTAEQAPAPPVTVPSWRLDLDLCVRHKSRLNFWEQAFVKGVQPRLTLTPRQNGILADIAHTLREAGLT